MTASFVTVSHNRYVNVELSSSKSCLKPMAWPLRRMLPPMLLLLLFAVECRRAVKSLEGKVDRNNKDLLRKAVVKVMVMLPKRLRIM